jgi:hypothetical protein
LAEGAGLEGWGETGYHLAASLGKRGRKAEGREEKHPLQSLPENWGWRRRVRWVRRKMGGGWGGIDLDLDPVPLQPPGIGRAEGRRHWDWGGSRQGRR